MRHLLSNVDMVHSLEGSTAVRLQSLRRIPYSIAHYALLYDGEVYNPQAEFRKLFPDKRSDGTVHYRE